MFFLSFLYSKIFHGKFRQFYLQNCNKNVHAVNFDHIFWRKTIPGNTRRVPGTRVLKSGPESEPDRNRHLKTGIGPEPAICYPVHH